VGKKRRTKKEKIIARLRRQVKKQKTPLRSDIYRNYARGATKIAKKTKQKSKAKNQKFFDYNPRLIQKDLRKTLFLSILFAAIIVALWFWQKTGWQLPKM